MTEDKTPPSSGIPAFYDRLAPDYDEMTGFGKRFVHEKPFFRPLVENLNIATALDAGCGTGFHSLLLAQLGVRVTAVDVSGGMLARLELHGREMEPGFCALPQPATASRTSPPDHSMRCSAWGIRSLIC